MKNVNFEAGVLTLKQTCEFEGCSQQSQVFWFTHQGGDLFKGYARSLCKEHAKLCTLAMEDDARRTQTDTLFFERPLPQKCLLPDCPNPTNFVTLLKISNAVEAYFLCSEHEGGNSIVMKDLLRSLTDAGLGQGMMLEGAALKTKLSGDKNNES